MRMELHTNTAKCEVCDNDTSRYVYVKYGFERGDLKVCSHCVEEMYGLMKN